MRPTGRAYARGVKLAFIDPGKPVQNAFVESFNGTFCQRRLRMPRFRRLKCPTLGDEPVTS